MSFKKKMIAIYFHTLKDTPTPRTFQMYPSFVWKSEETSGLPSIQSCKVPLQSHHKSGYGREALESLERLALKSRLETSSFRGGQTPTLRVFDGRDLLGFVLVVELKTFFIFTPIWREIIQLDEDDIFQLEFS